jgi:hypothetical protein
MGSYMERKVLEGVMCILSTRPSMLLEYRGGQCCAGPEGIQDTLDKPGYRTSLDKGITSSTVYLSL